MVPVRDRVTPRLHMELPQAFRGNGDLRAVAVGAWREVLHARAPAERALRVVRDHGRAEHLVPLAENGRGNLERLAANGLRWPAPALEDRLDIDYRDASDHSCQATHPDGVLIRQNVIFYRS